MIFKGSCNANNNMDLYTTRIEAAKIPVKILVGLDIIKYLWNYTDE